MKKILIVSLIFNVVLLVSFTDADFKNEKNEFVIQDTTFNVVMKNSELSYVFKGGVLKDIKIKGSNSFSQTLNFHESGLLNHYSKNEEIGMEKGVVIHDFESLSIDSLGNIYSILISEEGREILSLFKDGDYYYDVANMKEVIVFKKGQENIRILPVEE
jgi:hypothetical protein